jgi:hypothetical protein
MVAAMGVSLKELITRMGHSSPPAALMYQHATEQREAAIGRELDEHIRAARPEPTAPVIAIRPDTETGS